MPRVIGQGWPGVSAPCQPDLLDLIIYSFPLCQALLIAIAIINNYVVTEIDNPLSKTDSYFAVHSLGMRKCCRGCLAGGLASAMLSRSSLPERQARIKRRTASLINAFFARSNRCAI